MPGKIKAYIDNSNSDSTVSEDAGIEPRTVATLALTARRFNSARSRIHIWLDLILGRLDLIHTRLDLIHTIENVDHAFTMPEVTGLDDGDGPVEGDDENDAKEDDVEESTPCVVVCSKVGEAFAPAVDEDAVEIAVVRIKVVVDSSEDTAEVTADSLEDTAEVAVEVACFSVEADNCDEDSLLSRTHGLTSYKMRAFRVLLSKPLISS
jgi:hypothetical protein